MRGSVWREGCALRRSSCGLQASQLGLIPSLPAAHFQHALPLIFCLDIKCLLRNSNQRQAVICDGTILSVVCVPVGNLWRRLHWKHFSVKVFCLPRTTSCWEGHQGHETHLQHMQVQQSGSARITSEHPGSALLEHIFASCCLQT